MRVPGAKEAQIQRRKIEDYLLSTTHPAGKAKERFFASLGYSRRQWMRLARDLKGHLEGNPVTRATRGPHGMKYIVRGTLHCPTGVSAEIVSVWIVLDGERSPRFVTAYPGGRV